MFWKLLSLCTLLPLLSLGQSVNRTFELKNVPDSLQYYAGFLKKRLSSFSDLHFSPAATKGDWGVLLPTIEKSVYLVHADSVRYLYGMPVEDMLVTLDEDSVVFTVFVNLKSDADMITKLQTALGPENPVRWTAISVLEDDRVREPSDDHIWNIGGILLFTEPGKVLHRSGELTGKIITIGLRARP